MSYYDYYYGGYYTAEVLDTDAYLSDAKARKDAKDQSDTLYPIGIALLGMGITMVIVGGAMYDSTHHKMIGSGANNNKPNNYNIYLTTINTNTPALGIRYNF